MSTLSNISITIFVVMLVFIFTVDTRTVNPSLTPRNETKMDISNSTLYEINNSSESDVDGNTQSQSCKMPPCPPGEMCIQVCPESEPK
jgi:hypothetical protein